MGAVSILLVLSLILGLLATVNWPPATFSLGWLAFSFFVLAHLVAGGLPLLR